MKKDDKREILRFAREVILAYLEERSVVYPELESEPSGAFVTLHKHGKLRGCIGYIQADDQPLLDTIKDAALAASFKDSRFPPVKRSEVDELDIEISIISPFKKVENIGDIEIGVHGLMMKRGYRSGLFLPQVPIEQNWNLEEYLNNLCGKAGLPFESQNDPDTDIYSFTADVFGEKEL